jgi:SAM-dependent methyltransferase
MDNSPHALSLPDRPSLPSRGDPSGTPKLNQGRLLVSRLNLRPGERVLEVGAGTGELACYAAKFVVPGGHVTAIDPDPVRIAQAAARAPQNLSAWVGDAENLSAFADASLDAVYMNSVFHWLTDRELALKEAFRVLRPGGRIALNSANPGRPHQFTRLIRQAVNAQTGGAPWQWSSPLGFTASALQQSLITHGFGGVDLSLEEFADYYASPEVILELSQAYSYGHLTLPSHPNSILRARIIADFAARLEEFRTPSGFRLERYMIFATAIKAH